MTSPNEGGGPRPGERPGRAQVVGVGLIGASLGLALRAKGWHVTGDDTDRDRLATALELGALDATGEDLVAELVVVATPVGAVAGVARAALARFRPDTVVTDVGSVKASIVAAVDHPRFVGGHPMAGSEQDGPEGADPDLFVGATWVLTPTPRTDPVAFTRVRAVVTSLGADVVAVPPERHDALVAVVSHVPHLTAATLMAMAAEGAEEHGAMLRLAAGGFRDMTRIAAGNPGIWPDICAENAGAIAAALDRLVSGLLELREAVAARDRGRLLEALEHARAARRNLPGPVAAPEDLVEVRVPVVDRPGAFAEVTTTAGELGVNIVDIEVAHSAEGDRGVLILVVDAAAAGRLRDALQRSGMRPALRPLEGGAR